MLRILFHLGPLKVHSYGLLLMLAFAVGIALAVPRGRRRGIPSDAILDLSTQIILAAIVGSRLLYVATHREAYAGGLLDVLKVWEGGLTAYGGALAAVLVSVWFCRRKGVPFLRVADAMAPSLALGVGFARIGCFLNGCCFGKACAGAWGVRFPAGSLADSALGAVSVHPAQLYASAAAFTVSLILIAADRRPLREGLLFWWFLVLFGGSTFFTDFARYWEPGALVGGWDGVRLSLNQVLEIGFVVLGVLGIAIPRRGDHRGSKEREDGTR